MIVFCTQCKKSFDQEVSGYYQFCSSKCYNESLGYKEDDSGFYIRVKRGDKWVTVDGIYQASAEEFHSWFVTRVEPKYALLGMATVNTVRERWGWLDWLRRQGVYLVCIQGSEASERWHDTP